MDIISHSLWSFIAFRKWVKKTEIKKVVFFGILPDLLSWAIYLFYLLINGFRVIGKLPLENIPGWVFTLYGLTHSLFIFGGIVFGIYLVKKKVPVYIYAWALHIFIDIPTHSGEVLPTPFLYPVSRWQFSGISWWTPWFFVLNWAILITIIGIILMKKKSL